MESMEDRVIVIVREFFEDIEKKEPFETQLMDFRLRFRAKLLEIVTSFPTEEEIASRSLDYALEGIERILREEMEKVNLESEESLYRSIRILNTMNDVLKEFMRENRVNDKRRLSHLTGYIGKSVERLRHEYKKRFGGFLSGIKKLLGIGRSP